MTPVDIHAEVREQLVRGLRVQLRVVRGVEAAEGRDGVQGEVGEEEEGAAEGEAGDELEDEPPAARRVGRERAAGLERRGEGRVVQSWDEGRAVVLAGGRGRSSRRGAWCQGGRWRIFDRGEIREERGDVVAA